MANTTSRGRARERAAVAGRLVLAVLGGYGLAALATAVLSLVLPLTRSEAVTAATLLSFAVMAGTVVLVFAARSLPRVAAGMAGALLTLGACLWLAAAGGRP